MNLIIEIDDQHLLAQLRTELEAGGCSTEAVSPHRCRVLHEEANDVVEAFDELGFFVRAWARSRGDVAVRLRPDV